MLSKEYLQSARMSQSKLKWILYGADEFKYNAENPTPPSDSQNLGSAVHLMLLQPHLSERVICVDKPSGATRKGKIWKNLEVFKGEVTDAIAAMKPDKSEQDFIDDMLKQYSNYFVSPENFIALKPDEYDSAHRITQRVLANTACRDLLESCDYYEKIHLYRHKNIDFKAQLDGIGSDFILDLKTTRVLNDEKLIRNQVFGNLYHFQAASYMVAAPKKKYFIIFARTEAPYAVFPVQLSDQVLDEGRRKFDEACEAYTWCLANNPNFESSNEVRII